MYFILRLIGLFVVILSLLWVVLIGHAFVTNSPVGSLLGENLGEVDGRAALVSMGYGLAIFLAGCILVGFASVVENTWRSRRVLEKMLEIGSQE